MERRGPSGVSEGRTGRLCGCGPVTWSYGGTISVSCGGNCGSAPEGKPVSATLDGTASWAPRRRLMESGTFASV